MTAPHRPERQPCSGCSRSPSMDQPTFLVNLQWFADDDRSSNHDVEPVGRALKVTPHRGGQPGFEVMAVETRIPASQAATSGLSRLTSVPTKSAVFLVTTVRALDGTVFSLGTLAMFTSVLLERPDVRFVAAAPLNFDGLHAGQQHGAAAALEPLNEPLCAARFLRGSAMPVYGLDIDTVIRLVRGKAPALGCVTTHSAATSRSLPRLTRPDTFNCPPQGSSRRRTR